jgi:transcription-repair coupling factor (superfamily II helicase)
MTAEGGCPTIHLGTLSRGFIYEEAKLVVVTDAEIFGRYKCSVRAGSSHPTPRRRVRRSTLTSQNSRKAITWFTLQHGIGRFLGCKFLRPSAGP